MEESLDDLADSFLLHLRANGASRDTLRLYGQAVRFFRGWLVDTGHPDALDSVARNLIVQWIAHLTDGRGLAPNTVRARHKGLQRFCKWLVDEEIIAKNPMSGMASPKMTRKPVAILSDEQMRAMVKACSGKRFIDRRDEAVVRLLNNCGVRVSELVGLQMADVNLQMGTAMVVGKGGDRRQIYLDARTGQAMDRYFRARRSHRWSHLDDVFLGQRGKLSTDGVRNLLETRAEIAGVPHVHPHRFRHTMSHDFLAAGGQERDLKRLNGWKSDVMLEVYASSLADVRAEGAARRLRRGDRI